MDGHVKLHIKLFKPSHLSPSISWRDVVKTFLFGFVLGTRESIGEGIVISYKIK